jgi:hypothetical protein
MPECANAGLKDDNTQGTFQRELQPDDSAF